jgi:streptogramin lyase
MRLDPDGRDAKLEWPNLTGFISFTKSPDGSVWMLTYAGIFRTRVEGNRLSIVERYPVEVQNDDCLWCDREGRVWMAHTHAPKTGHGEVYRELIRFATKP